MPVNQSCHSSSSPVGMVINKGEGKVRGGVGKGRQARWGKGYNYSNKYTGEMQLVGQARVGW